MKTRKILSFTLAVLTVFSLCLGPLPAYGEEVPQIQGDVQEAAPAENISGDSISGGAENCICTEKCAPDKPNEDCQVCSEDWNKCACSQPQCICGSLCTAESINADCPVCSAAGADLSKCAGSSSGAQEPENTPGQVCAQLPECVDGSHGADCPLYVPETEEDNADKETEPQPSAPENEPAPLTTDTGLSADDPMELPFEAMVIIDGSYYGVSKSWFEQVNPDKATMFFSITVPNNVSTVAANAFRDSYSSEKKNYGAVTSNDNLGRYNVVAIDFSQAVGLTTIKSQAALRCSLTGVLDLSNTKISTIEKSAFSGCTGLTGVVLPNTLQVLGATDGSSGSVFNGCTGLQFVRTAGGDPEAIFQLPDGLRVIGKQSFRNSFAKGADLKIRIPASVEIIGSEAFYSNSAFSQIYIERQSDYEGYNSGAFKAKAAGDCLLIFPNSDAYESTGSYTRVTKTYPVTLDFINNSGPAVSQLKLYGQSIRYTKGGDGFWYVDSGYMLPDTNEPGTVPGYDAGWVIYGSTSVLTTSSKVTGWPDDRLEVTIKNNSIVSKPDVEFTVNGEPVGKTGGVEKLNVTVDGSQPGRVGIAVSHPLATEEARKSGTYVYFKYCWWDEVDDGVNGPRSTEQPDIFSSSESSGKLNREFTDYNEIDIRSAADERTDGDYYLVELYGYYVENNGNPKQFYKSNHNFIGVGQDGNAGEGFVMEVKVKDESPVTIRPADVTIYMGGESGHKGVIDKDGQLVAANSLPVPGFVVELPSGLQGISMDNLSLQYEQEDGSTLKWVFEPYGPGNHSIFRIVPESGTDTRHIRMKFTNAQGQVVADDSLDIRAEINQTLTMEVYGEGIEAGKVSLVYINKNDPDDIKNGERYKIDVGEARVYVRGTTGGADYGRLGQGLPQTGSPGITAEAGTIFTVNSSAVEVENPDGIALLFDDIIEVNTEGKSNSQLLADRADKELQSSRILGKAGFNYEFKYLNLVDVNNGNCWVSASEPITVHWPLPEGTTKDTEFELLHFKGLHRDMGVDQVGDNIMSEEQTVDNLTGSIIEVTDSHLVFTAGLDGFSPFALAWPASATGSLSVSKTVSGSAGETDREFNFTVTLSDDSIDGSYGDMSFTKGAATFSLKHGQSKTASGLPEGITYEVTEAEANKDGYVTSSTGASGTVVSGQTAAAAFTNTKNGGTPPSSTGSISVSKVVSGNGGNTDKYFSFTVVLGDKTINGWYDQMNFTDGVATFSLKHGESRTAGSLPAGTAYQVYEAEANKDNYRTTSKNAAGTIQADTTVQVSFTNYRAYAFGGFVPHTGDESNLGLWMAAGTVSLLGIGGAAMFILRRKRREKGEQ